MRGDFGSHEIAAIPDVVRNLAIEVVPEKSIESWKGGQIMKVKPLADRVLVKPQEETEVKKGGIIIPDTAKEKPQQGEVVAVGPGKVTESGQKVPMEVKKGDTILYGKYSGTEVTVEGQDYLIMRESDILAVI
jgi:chaperonin GroES